MSVIQSIQEKYAKVMAVIIAIALIMFVVMLAFENGGSLFSDGPTTSVGKVNGQSIDYNAFVQKVDQEESFLQSQGYPAGPFLRQEALQQAWNREVNRLLMTGEIKKLGIDIGKKELGDILYGENAPQDIRQNFTDPNTGIFNPLAAKQAIDQQLKSSTPEAKAQINAYIEQLEFARQNEKYSSLLTNSINFPKWMLEKQNADNSQLANISIVREFYSSVPDSAVKVTDKEIQDYINKRKEEFKQQETRSIAYVSFSALPTSVDTLATYQRLLQEKAAFDTTDDLKQFLLSQGVENFYNGYISGNRIQIGAKDSIFRLPINGIYGPYLDGNSYAMAKLIGVKTQADTVTVRHILIGLTQQNPQTGQSVMIRDTATAYKLADSIRAAISHGSNFDTLCLQFSDDQGKYNQQTGQYTGGKYENVTSGTMVPEFNDYIFGMPVGSKGIVKTDFGYHYIEILSQKGRSAAYKVAYLNQMIEASSETDRAASSEATMFAGESRNQKSFDANAEKLKEKGINKLFATDITPTASQIMGVGASRQFVKEIYNAKLGQVLEPERVGDSYVVALVAEINKEGTQSAAKARMVVEPILRNKKKAEVLKAKLGAITTLEAAAATLGGRSIETVDSLRMEGGYSPIIGGETKVIGAAFNPANKGKVVPELIDGTSGVYVVRVESVYTTPIADANVAEQRKQRYNQAKMRGAYPGQALMESAKITDKRAKLF